MHPLSFFPRLASASGAIFLFASTLDVCAQTAPSNDALPPARPNVLFIMSDDLNCDIGSYGVAGMHTPNIDALARRGVRFERAYCQYPQCSPSRSSMLTGRLPDVTGVTANPSKKTPLSPHFREKIPETVALPQLFRNNGWTTARVGKIYHYGVPGEIGTSGLDDNFSWDFTVNPRGRDRDPKTKIFSLRPGEYSSTLSWLEDESGSDAEQTDGLVASAAIELLERFQKQQKPFFLGVGFFRPHVPFVAPKNYFDLYSPEKIALPELSDEDRARTPAPAFLSANKHNDAMTDAQRRQAIQAYHASVSFMDAQVGRVLAALDRLGLAENTIVVLVSDHGFHLADHGLWSKTTLFERATRVPLVIAAPSHFPAAQNKSATGVVELLDIYPTLAELSNLKTPDYLDGTSLVPMLRDPNVVVKEAARMQVNRSSATGRAVRTARWRYVEWDGGAKGTQLYDMEADPAETKNLAATQPEVVAQLKTLLAPAPPSERSKP